MIPLIVVLVVKHHVWVIVVAARVVVVVTVVQGNRRIRFPGLIGLGNVEVSTNDGVAGSKGVWRRIGWR